ncbi:MAG: D-2-hydroxyacid dehydrogenase [Saprospiraceae bacterium]
MAKILINDGIHPTGVQLLKDAGHDIILNKIEQADLPSQLPSFDAICVRSATKVRADLIDVCPKLKAIGRGGVGLDNIDVSHAKSKGIDVLNTPAASSRSVAELVFAHLLSLARSLYNSNRKMPVKGDTEFKSLKKSYSKGFEIQGKTLGVIGFGRIGQATAEIALSMGMKVMAVDPFINEAQLRIGGKNIGMDVTISTVPMDEMLLSADIITLHIPNLGKYVLSTDEFSKMKDGTILINCSRGGTVDEEAMLVALGSGKLGGAGLDVFENEPTPKNAILSHSKISLTPHTGASTGEAQEKIGIELAEKLIAVFK